jgi:hypothetical protein
LEMKTRQIVSDTDAIGDGVKPVVPVTYPVIQLKEPGDLNSASVPDDEKICKKLTIMP